MKRSHSVALLLFGIVLLWGVAVHAGMPSPLPTNWTKENTPVWAPSSGWSSNGSADARWQAISFFIACLLLSAWAVKWLWRMLRTNITWLPVLGYRRSLSLVVLWGLLLVIVLTMISGARELMTPGAWRQQGWTYKLADSTGSALTTPDLRSERRQALEQLRLAMWQYAATHQGRFPAIDDAAIDAKLWNLPGWPGVRFLSVPNREAEETGRLLVFEPELYGNERQVLLTNGMLGTMRTVEIQQALSSVSEP